MRHHTNSRRLGVKTGHRTAMLRNLSKSLVEHGRIKTTVARAKNLRPFLEKVVTKLKDPNLHNIRQATSTLADKDTVKKIIDEIAPKLKTRAGGYLRILKLAQARVGDNADMALSLIHI